LCLSQLNLLINKDLTVKISVLILKFAQLILKQNSIDFELTGFLKNISNNG